MPHKNAAKGRTMGGWTFSPCQGESVFYLDSCLGSGTGGKASNTIGKDWISDQTSKALHVHNTFSKYFLHLFLEQAWLTNTPRTWTDQKAS